MRNWISLKFFSLLADRKGISAMEYAILAAAILGAVTTAVSTLGTDIGALFTNLGDYIKGIKMPGAG